MQYDVEAPREYLDALDDDWRKTRLLEVREMISELAPDWREGIEYKMLGYFDRAGSVMHLNAQRAYVGLYVGNIAKIDPDGALLAGLDLGKGCVRLKKRNGIATTGLREFLKRLVNLRAEGVYLSC